MTARAPSSSANAAALWILAALAAVFFMRAARALLIPIALAVLISYALEPVVAWLERHRVPRMIGTALTLLLLLAALSGGAYALKDDAVEVIEALPQAAQKAREHVLSQLGSGSEALQKATIALGTSGASASGDAQGASAGGSANDTANTSIIQRGVGAIFSLAGNLVVIFFLIFFLLISGQHLRNRIVEVSGPDSESRRLASAIIDDINAQIQRYLLVLVFTAVIVGAVTWAVLAWMNVRHAAMWGILAGVFNSIPYFGPVIVSGGLLVIGLVQGGGFTEALKMSGAAIVITSLEGWLLTPPLMGKAERMSAVAVFLGLLLWTWIWGGWGTVLAVPMLAVIKSVADHLERFKPVGRLMAP